MNAIRIGAILILFFGSIAQAEKRNFKDQLKCYESLDSYSSDFASRVYSVKTSVLSSAEFALLKKVQKEGEARQFFLFHKSQDYICTLPKKPFRKIGKTDNHSIQIKFSTIKGEKNFMERRTLLMRYFDDTTDTKIKGFGVSAEVGTSVRDFGFNHASEVPTANQKLNNSPVAKCEALTSREGVDFFNSDLRQRIANVIPRFNGRSFYNSQREEKATEFKKRVKPCLKLPGSLGELAKKVSQDFDNPQIAKTLLNRGESAPENQSDSYRDTGK